MLPGVMLALGVGGAFFWAYWPTWQALARRWETDSRASHGFLVPGVALLLLWLRREHMPARREGPGWEGPGLLLLAGVLRLLGAYLFIEWLDYVSLVVALAGCWGLVGGAPALAWGWPALAYLIFMIPLPFQVEVALAGPLQRLATQASTYTLQTLGYPAVAEGNVILVNDMQIGVLEACNGLGMLLAFFAVSGALALILQRPLWERVVLFLSAVPVGVLVNQARITLTAVAALQLHDAGAFDRFHDVAGWLMMPVALLLLWLEQAFLGRLVLPRQGQSPVPLYLPPATPREPSFRAPEAVEEGQPFSASLSAVGLPHQVGRRG